MSLNESLRRARRQRNDEFYTQLSDIENELRHYTRQFRGQVVYCNCDDPRVSNFFHYFSYNFERLGLKKLITACYRNQDRDMFSRHDSERAIWLEYNGNARGGRVPDVGDIGIREFEGDGDFRSAECIELLTQADIVVTNPPFSLFREYVRQLVADTFGGDGGWIDGAMELCGANIRHRDTHVWNQGARQMDAGSAQLSAGRLKAAAEALDLFMGAEYSFRIASWHFDKGGFPRDWAAAQNARGLAKAHFCFRYEEATGRPPPEGSWTGAEDCYRTAMDVHVDASPVQWAKTRINLGYLMVHRGRAEGGEAGEMWLRHAVDDCRGAQEALRADVERDVWVDAQQIIAEALLELAGIVQQEDAEAHLFQAMVELTTAKDLLAGEELPFAEAGVDRLMARLERQAARLGGG